MNLLELKIPPPLVGLTIALAMWGAKILFPTAALRVPTAIQLVAALVAVSGIAVALAGVVAFRRAQTTVNPLKPESSTSLVTAGIYSRTRNPMYVGMLLVLCAWALCLGSFFGIAGPVVFVLYITRFQILPEERAMIKLFGATFAEYCTRVRRWA